MLEQDDTLLAVLRRHLLSTDALVLSPAALLTVSERVRHCSPATGQSEAAAASSSKPLLLEDYQDAQFLRAACGSLRRLRLHGPPAAPADKGDEGGLAVGDATADLALFPMLEALELEGCHFRRLLSPPATLRCIESARHGGACASHVPTARRGHQHRSHLFTSVASPLLRSGGVDFGELLSETDHLLALSWTHASLRSSEGLGHLCALRQLDLSYNEITRIDGLAACVQLQHLDLGHNRISTAEGFHAELGNLRTLVLCHNELTKVADLDRLFSLHALDLTANQLDDAEALGRLARLPCLESLWLHANPIASGAGYWAACRDAFAKDPRTGEGARGRVHVDGVLVTHVSAKLGADARP